MVDHTEVLDSRRCPWGCPQGRKIRDRFLGRLGFVVEVGKPVFSVKPAEELLQLRWPKPSSHPGAVAQESRLGRPLPSLPAGRCLGVRVRAPIARGCRRGDGKLRAAEVLGLTVAHAAGADGPVLRARMGRSQRKSRSCPMLRQRFWKRSALIVREFQGAGVSPTSGVATGAGIRRPSTKGSGARTRSGCSVQSSFLATGFTCICQTSPTN